MDIHTVAGNLLGSAPEAVVPAGGGGNSRIYKVTAGSRHYALKAYPVIPGDTRDRLSAETRALRLFADHGIICVPEIFATAPGYVLLEWIEGTVVTAPDAADIDSAAQFIASVKALNGLDDAAAFPPASEACFCGDDVLAQIGQRFGRLSAIGELKEFLQQEWQPAFEAAEKAARSASKEFSTPLPRAKQSLIPADFGFHNALKNAGGALIFLDFEYFGWDDPVKLTADFLLHPGTALPADLRAQLKQRLTAIFAEDPGFSPRLHALMPLFALRWSLILLNEFLPERWKARANTHTSWEDAKKAQLAKARAMLKMIHHARSS